MDAIRSVPQTRTKRHYESKISRDKTIRAIVYDSIYHMPVKTKIITRLYSKELGKIKGTEVDPPRLRVFLRDMECLKYNGEAFVKVKETEYMCTTCKKKLAVRQDKDIINCEEFDWINPTSKCEQYTKILMV